MSPDVEAFFISRGVLMAKGKVPTSEDRFRPMLSPRQVADRIGISKDKVYQAIADKEIRVTQFGSRLRISEEEVQRLKADGLRSVNRKR